MQTSFGKRMQTRMIANSSDEDDADIQTMTTMCLDRPRLLLLLLEPAASSPWHPPATQRSAIYSGTSLPNEDLGTIKITLLYQVSHYIRVKKQRNIKSWDQENYLVIKRVLLYPTSL